MKHIERPTIFGSDPDTVSVRNSSWLDINRTLTDVFYTDYYIRAQQITPIRVFVCLIGALFFFGLWHRAAMISALSVVSTLVVLYRFALKQAESIEVARVSPESANEDDLVELEYVIQSRSKWPISPVYLGDSFSGNLQHEFELQSGDTTQALAPLAITRIKKKIRVDGGMGKHRLGPIELWITDPIGVFRFRVFFDTPSEIEIYPKPVPLPELHVEGSPFSFQFGNYESAIKGASTNFIGVREYEPGDSIRQICWKISSRRPGGLLVKEFEKTVNSEITFLLNLNQSEHSGEKSHSSWESCKDVTLSLAAQHVSNGNSIQLITTDGQMGFGRGRDHGHLLMRWLYPKLPHADIPLHNWISQALDSIPVRSTVFLITPVLHHSPEALFEASRTLLARDVDLTVILARSPSYVHYEGDPVIKQSLASAELAAQKTLARLIDSLAPAGVRVFVLDGKSPLQKSLLKEATV